MGVYIVLSYFVMFFVCCYLALRDKEFKAPMKWFVFAPITIVFVGLRCLSGFFTWLLDD